MAAIEVTLGNADNNSIANGGRVLVRNSDGVPYVITQNLSDSAIDCFKGETGLEQEYTPNDDWSWSAGRNEWGQTFKPRGNDITKVAFSIQKVGSPTGSITAKLYAHSGTFGSDGVGTGAALATSTTSIICTDLPTSYAWIEFEFSSLSVTPNTPYVIVMATDGTHDTSNHVKAQIEDGSPTAPGNWATVTGTTWTPLSTLDLNYRIYSTLWFEEVDAANRPSGTIYGASSAAIDSSDVIHISYMSDAGKASPLLYATFRADGINDDWLTTDVTLVSDIGEDPLDLGNLYTAIAIDISDVPHIAFIKFPKIGGATTYTLAYINKVDGSWNTSVNIHYVQNADAYGVDMTIDFSNRPCLAYHVYDSGDIVYAAIGNGNNATSFTLQAVDSSASAARHSIAIDSSGNHWISYTIASGTAVKIAKHVVDDSWATWAPYANGGTSSLWPTNTSLFIDGTDVYVLYDNSDDDIVYDMFNGSTWAGETSLATGTFNSVKASWASVVHNDSTGPIVSISAPLNTYYFDASVAGPTDVNAKWANEANFVDESVLTNASYSENPSSSADDILQEGTSAPSSGFSITKVEARFISENTAGYTGAKLAIRDSTDTLLVQFTANHSAGAAWTDYEDVPAPATGWTWSELAGLYCDIGPDTDLAAPGTLDVYKAEIRVTTLTITPSAAAEISYVYQDEESLVDIFFNTLALGDDGTNDELTAAGIVTGSPVVAEPSLSQEHSLISTGITTQAPVLGSPTVSEVHELTATGITAGSPALGTPTLTEDTNNELTATDIVSQAPVLGSPTLTEDTNNELTATGIVSQVPVLGSPTLTEDINNELTATGITVGSPVLGTPTFTANSPLTATGIIAGSPVLESPDLTQDHDLLATGITAQAPVLAMPVLSQNHLLTSTEIAAGNPVLETASLTVGDINDELTAVDITTGFPVLGTPTFTANSQLTATGVVSQAPVLGVATLTEDTNNELTATGIVSQVPVLGSPTLTEDTNNELAATGIATGAPTLATAALAQDFKLTGTGIVSGQPAVGTGTLAQVHALTSTGVTSGAPDLGTAVLAQDHNLSSGNITSGSPMLVQFDSYDESNRSTEWGIHRESTDAIAQSITAIGGMLESVELVLRRWGNPPGDFYIRLYEHSGVFGSSSEPTGTPLAEIVIAASSVSTTRRRRTYSFSPQYELVDGEHYVISAEYESGNTSNKIFVGYDDTSPTHDGNMSWRFGTGWSSNTAWDLVFYLNAYQSLTITQEHNLVTADIITQAPVVGSATLTEDTNNELTATDILTNAPILEQATLAVSGVLLASGILTSVPALATPSLSQNHLLTSTGITAASPVLATPLLSQNYILTATGITTSDPVIATATLAQNHNLTGTGIVSSSPILTAAVLIEDTNNELTATNILTNAPILEQPTLAVSGVLLAYNILTSVPALATPSLSQNHLLTSTGITAASPVLATPSLSQDHILAAQGITSQPPILGTASLTSDTNDELTAQDITTGIPEFGSTTLTQNYTLISSDLVSGLPILDEPTFTQDYPLISSDIITGVPFFEETLLSQEHDLTATDITSGIPVLGIGTMGQVHALDAFAILSGQPVVEMAYRLPTGDVIIEFREKSPIIDVNISRNPEMFFSEIMPDILFLD